ncbi:MAG: hypothetical protein ACLT0Y_08980 [Christensenellales bacterium]
MPCSEKAEPEKAQHEQQGNKGCGRGKARAEQPSEKPSIRIYFWAA